MMKFIQCSLVMLMLFTTSISMANEHFPLSAEISRGPVNVRSGANTNFEIVSKLNQGDKIIVLDKSYEWYKIQLPLQSEAYIRADYIKEINKEAGEILGTRLNIRSKPDSTSSVLGQLNQGDIVRLIKKNADWWQIEPPSGTIAWVHGSFVTLSNIPTTQAALREPLKIEDFVKTVKKIEPPKITSFSSTGILKVLSEDIFPHVHYKIVANGQTICYVEDVENLSKFKDAVVKIEGILKESKTMLTYPVITLNKISLVL